MTQPQSIPYASVDAQSAIDAGHLRALAICHYVWGGLIMALSSIFIIHLAMGIAMMTGVLPVPGSPNQPPPPAWLGLFLVVMGGGAVLLGWTTGILTIFSGRSIAKRRRRTFTLVMAGISCLSVPIGTILGVFTFVVLARPSVKMMYDQASSR